MKVEEKLLLTPKDIKPSKKGWKVIGVLNPAAVRLPNKKIMLAVRVAEVPKAGTKRKRLPLPNISHLRNVLLDETGFNVKKIAEKHFLNLKKGESEYGIEDARITKLKNKYYMTYVGVSAEKGVSTYLAVSKDLKRWKRVGLMFREQNKDVVLFPEKINGKYVALNRPESGFKFSKPGIWISYSPDLIHWGDGEKILRTRISSWENERNGAGAPPIKTKKGWLVIYHGKSFRRKGKYYVAGAALLNLKNPEKIIARSSPEDPLFKPTKKYEKSGYENNVVFPTGAIWSLDEKSLLIYSGAADSVVTVKKIKIKDIFEHLGVK